MTTIDNPRTQALDTVTAWGEALAHNGGIAQRRRHDGALFTVIQPPQPPTDQSGRRSDNLIAVTALIDRHGAITLRAHLGPAPEWLDDRHDLALTDPTPTIPPATQITVVRRGELADAYARCSQPTPERLLALTFLLCGLADEAVHIPTP